MLCPIVVGPNYFGSRSYVDALWLERIVGYRHRDDGITSSNGPGRNRDLRKDCEGDKYQRDN